MLKSLFVKYKGVNMKLPGKEIFRSNKVLLVGYSSKSGAFSKMVYNEMEAAGIDVYPYNPNKGEYDIEVYSSLDSINDLPETAVVLVGPEHIDSALNDLIKSNVKTIIINRKMKIDSKILTHCNDNSIEIKFFCPLLIVGKGFHKVHKFFATLF